MLKAGYILLTVILSAVILVIVARAADRAYADPRRRTSIKLQSLLVLVSWLAYVTIMSLSGIFLDPTFPPRVPVLLVLPYAIFIWYFLLRGRFRSLMKAMPLHWLIYLQSFRAVFELLLFGVFMEYVMPWSPTFEGINFDIGIGITAPFVGYLASKGRVHKWALRLWNILGLVTLLIVTGTLNTYAYRPWVFHESTTILGKGFGTFPFTFMASFFIPTALFTHTICLIKLRQEAKPEPSKPQ